MKKIILGIYVIMMCCSWDVLAQSRTAKGMNEAEQLGTAAGLALACNAGESLKNYEMISSRIIANKATDDADEQAGLMAYATEKLRAMNEQKNKPQMTCDQVIRLFESMPIFRASVYTDGTVQMPDGRMLKPRAQKVKPPKSAKPKTITRKK